MYKIFTIMLYNRAKKDAGHKHAIGFLAVSMFIYAGTTDPLYTYPTSSYRVSDYLPSPLLQCKSSRQSLSLSLHFRTSTSTYRA